MLCHWKEPDPPKRFRCVNCGFTASRREISVLPYNRVCRSSRPERPADCLHLGDESRREECSTCNGTVRLKVFECAVHGECTVKKAISGIACCNQCPQYANEQ